MNQYYAIQRVRSVHSKLCCRGGFTEGRFLFMRKQGSCTVAHTIDSPAPSWELIALSGRRLGFCDHYSGGHRVRLVSQSNEHLPLSTVEGSRVDVPQFQLSLVSRAS
ncbi:hypothetical protein C5167_037134 [Papaver somniferum]|uniref:Uncharacterized protein n=1 Tax=Papaver somniferum TaxID=3469 RepID=A0A4Y7I5G6_PAPSO|nr:hypothetical protein C5167_037134 [Papaver somniferum]